MWRAWLGLCVLAALMVPAAGATAESAAPDPGMIGVRLLEVPVNRADDPRARIYIVDHLPPGTTIHRRIEVSNTTAEQVAVSVYEAAARVNGGTFTGAPDRTTDDLTTWTSVDQQDFPLRAGGAQPLTVTITVPRDASEGERFGVVWAEVRSAASGSVTAVNRVGIRIYLSVGPGGEPASAMHIETLTAGRSTESLPVVTARVRNTGGRALDIGGQLTLNGGPGGLSGGPFAAKTSTTLRPGEAGDVTVTLDSGMPAGPWNAHLELKSGLLTESADATITFPAAASTAAAPVGVGDPPGLLWPAVFAGFAVLVLLVLLWAWKRRRQRAATLQPGRG
ncbi:COG1470 family protein [Arthrobacter sp. UYCu723]